MTGRSFEGVAGVLIWTEAERFPAMARFYRDTLGLTTRSAKPDFVNFDWSGVRLSVGVHDRVHGESRDPLRIMINLAVADIRAVHERLARAGVVFTRAPEREEWGGWVATFADPDGNTLQLMQLTDHMGGPDMAPHTPHAGAPPPRRAGERPQPQRSERPGGAGPLLETPTGT